MQMLVDFHDSLQENRHDTGEGGGDDGHADGAEEPFAFFILRVDIRLQILRAGDRPCLCVPDPPAVNERAVGKIQDRQHDEQLPEAREKVPCAVDSVDKDKHVGK